MRYICKETNMNEGVIVHTKIPLQQTHVDSFNSCCYTHIQKHTQKICLSLIRVNTETYYKKIVHNDLSRFEMTA